MLEVLFFGVLATLFVALLLSHGWFPLPTSGEGILFFVGILAIIMAVFVIYKMLLGAWTQLTEVIHRRIANTNPFAAAVIPVSEPAGAHIFFWESCDQNDFFASSVTKEETQAIIKQFEGVGRVEVDVEGKGVIRLQPRNVYGDEWVIVHYRVNLGSVKTLMVNVKSKSATVHTTVPCEELKTRGLSFATECSS